MKSSNKQVIPRLADKKECTACLACENICPKQVIHHYTSDDGHVYIGLNSDECVGCLKCQEVCKKSLLNHGRNDITQSTIFASWASNEKVREGSTSGGAIAAIAEAVIRSGGCVIGATINKYECKHVCVFTVEDICKIQGSKYLASSMEDVYSIISEELPRRNVLFTGLGCQCAGVLAFFDGFKSDYQLYTVDLVCGGVPSQLLVDRFAAQNQDIVGFVSFRSKTKYELKVKTRDGYRIVQDKSLPLHGFNCGLTNRFSCYNCQFAKAHRRTDITVGDLWDQSVVPREHKCGVSMVIVHSLVGFTLLNSAELESSVVGWEGPLQSNRRVVCGHQHVFYPRKKLEKYYKHMSASRFTKLFTISMKPVDIDLYLFRVYRFIINRLLAVMNSRKIKRMLRAGGKKD